MTTLTTEQQTTVSQNERNNEIATIIVDQLGGNRRLRAFINAKKFTPVENGVAFNRMRGRPGSGNYTRITLVNDMYNVEQIEVRVTRAKVTMNVKSSVEGIYFDQLEEIMWSETGLALSL